MAEHTQLNDAIDIRTTTRAYDPEAIAEDQARQLSTTIEAVNTLSGLHLQLIRDCPDVFAQANASGHFTNARNFIAVVGPKHSSEGKERAGFYAERIVLAATLYGLGTGWVAGSWDATAAAAHCSIDDDEELYLGITIGNPQEHMRHLSSAFESLSAAQRDHRDSISVEEAIPGMIPDELDSAPDYLIKGVRAVLKAPSAMNRQPIRFSYDPQSGEVRAGFAPEATGDHLFNDLGIAKLHFQIGAGGGTWQWGEGAPFIRA